MVALLAAAVLPLAGCDDDSTGPQTGSAAFSLYLTDAPGDVHAAVITVSQVYLQRDDTPEDGGGGTAEGEPGQEVDGRVVLIDDPFTVDLSTLESEIEALVEDLPIPEGRYQQLRLLVTGGYLAAENQQGELEVYVSNGYTPPAAFAFETYLPTLLDDDLEPFEIAGVAGELRMPSFAQSGLKVDFAEQGGALDVNGETALLLDFDVSESFGRQAGNSGLWVMQPVIRATVVEDISEVSTSHGPVR